MANPAQFENNYFTEVCSGSEAGSYLRLVDFVYYSSLGLRVVKLKNFGEARLCSIPKLTDLCYKPRMLTFKESLNLTGAA